MYTVLTPNLSNVAFALSLLPGSPAPLPPKKPVNNILHNAPVIIKLQDQKNILFFSGKASPLQLAFRAFVP